MAELTLSQKITMANTSSFQDRMKGAFEHIAKYRRDEVAPGESPTDAQKLAFINKQTQLRKVYADRILNGVFPDMVSVCMFFLQIYTEANPDLIGAPSPLEGQLSDTVLKNGTWLDPTFDYFANVKAGYDSQPIEWSLS